MQRTYNGPELILASKSPRRKSLLRQAGLRFRVVPSDIDENDVAVSSPETYVRELAEAKAVDVSGKYPRNWVIGADTIVLFNGKILGKPDSRNQARQMLKQLSGNTHRVLTGYTICSSARDRTFTESVQTDVCFKPLTDEEIEWYIHTEEPFDKAGAYAIQGLGTFLVKRISGSYTNVVGLPVCEVMAYLLKEGIIQLNTSNED